jgi:hypothetical protein
LFFAVVLSRYLAAAAVTSALPRPACVLSFLPPALQYWHCPIIARFQPLLESTGSHFPAPGEPWCGSMLRGVFIYPTTFDTCISRRGIPILCGLFFSLFVFLSYFPVIMRRLDWVQQESLSIGKNVLYITQPHAHLPPRPHRALQLLFSWSFVLERERSEMKNRTADNWERDHADDDGRLPVMTFNALRRASGRPRDRKKKFGTSTSSHHKIRQHCIPLRLACLKFVFCLNICCILACLSPLLLLLLSTTLCVSM